MRLPQTRRFLAPTASLVLTSLSLGILAPRPVLADPPANSGSWTNAFTDNFDTLDYNVWHNGYPAWDGGYHDSPYRFDYGYMPDADTGGTKFNSGSNVWTSGGNLVIQARKEANRGGGEYTTGYINSANRKTFTYGYFEIRAKFQSSAGQDPGFWLFPNRNAWPPEIDIVEIPGRGNGLEAQFNGHWRTDNEFNNPQGFTASLNSPYSVSTDPNTFHTYAALWDPDKMIFYYDGVEVHRIVGKSPRIPMNLNIALELQGDSGGFYGNPANGTFPSTQYIDYVKVWSHDGGAAVPQLDETNLTRTISGATITARGENAPNETKEKSFDNNTGTKWLDFGSGSARSSWIAWTMPSGTKKIANRLALTAPAGATERQPRNITIYGIKDDGTWQSITTATVPLSYSLQRRVVNFSNTTAYKGYVLGIDSVQNTSTANSVQIAEVEWLTLGNPTGGLTNNGIYEIEAANASGAGTTMVLDVRESKFANGTVVQSYWRNNGLGQRWKIEQQSDGNYELIPQVYSGGGQRLDVQNGGGAGSLLQLYQDLNNGPQRWKFTQQSDGTYTISPSYNNALFLQNPAGGVQCTVNTTAQKWRMNLK